MDICSRRIFVGNVSNSKCRRYLARATSDYWEMTSRNPFDDLIASVTIIGTSVIGIGIIFYYVIKYSK